MSCLIIQPGNKNVCLGVGERLLVVRVVPVVTDRDLLSNARVPEPSSDTSAE